MADRFVAAGAGPLFAQLVARFPDWGRNTLRQRLRLGCIDVNGVPTNRHDQALVPGDVVTVRGKGEGRAVAPIAPFPVLFVDDRLCAIDKPAGLLSVATDDERERTALRLLKQHLGRGRAIDLWPLHRLDRETSGVLLFACSLAARAAVQADWASAQKVYAAVVEGHPEPAQDTIDEPLWEDDNLRVRTGAHPTARSARTEYTTIARGGSRTLLDVALHTGRKHQIRAHLAARGHPVVGDDRYGRADRRLCLHARRLVIRHPDDGRDLVLESPVPPALSAALAAT